MNKTKRTFQAGAYIAPALELHEFGVEQGFANSLTDDYLEIKGDDYGDGPGFGGGGYNDLDF